LLSAAVMSTTDSVYITALDNTIIFVNNAFCNTYGYQQDDVIGKNSDILCSRNCEAEDNAQQYQNSESAEVEIYHIRKDGSEFPISVSRSPIKDENGNEIAFVGVARDISARIFVEDKVRTLNLKLKNGIRLTS